MSEKELQELITKEEVQATVASNFRYLRKELGLSAQKMGEKLGLSRQSYEAIESCKSNAASNVINMTRYCGISLENIFLNDLLMQGAEIKKENPGD